MLPDLWAVHPNIANLSLSLIATLGVSFTSLRLVWEDLAERFDFFCECTEPPLLLFRLLLRSLFFGFYKYIPAISLSLALRVGGNAFCSFYSFLNFRSKSMYSRFVAAITLGTRFLWTVFSGYLLIVTLSYMPMVGNSLRIFSLTSKFCLRV